MLLMRLNGQVNLRIYAEQVNLIAALRAEYLLLQGRLILADVAFATAENLESCKAEAGEYWDDQEHYLVMEAIAPTFEQRRLHWNYRQVSHCGGVLEVWPQ